MSLHHFLLRRQAVDFFESYAPVVQWTSIHLIFIIAIVLNWTTVQTDY